MLETWRLSLQIVRRNWCVYRKDFLANISPTLADPAFLILSLGVGLGGFVTRVEGRSYVEFLAPGLAVSTALFTAFFECSYGFYVRLTFENVYDAMLTTPIGPREVVLGEFLWVACKGALMVTGVSVVLCAFGLFVSWPNLFLVPLIGALIALPLGGIGLIASSLVSNINGFQTVYSFVISPLYFFSGIFFPVDRMPAGLGQVARSLPIYHAVKLCRAVYWDQDVGGAWMAHVPALLAWTAVIVPITFWRVRRRIG